MAQADSHAAPSPPPGCLIASLDAELFPKKETLYQTLCVHGLFGRTIGLWYSHAIDNARVREFMTENKVLLDQEEVDDRKSPIFAICSRDGADLIAALDLYLTPKGPRQQPTYLSSLSPERNDRLADDYSKLATPQDRRQRFRVVAGPDMVAHLENATRYFRKHPRAVLPRIQEKGLFDSASRALVQIDRSRLSLMELGIIDKMFEAMDSWNPADGYQSRERLHEAVYQGSRPPRVWRGRVDSRYVMAELPKRNQWRYLVDALSNEHNAELYGLNVVTTPDLQIPSGLRTVPSLEQGSLYVEEKELLLPSTVYTEHLDFNFVVDLRRKPEFWDTLERLEADPDAASAMGDHLQVISEAFARYLIVEKKRPDLVHTTRARIITKQINLIEYGTGAVAAAALVYGLPRLTAGFGIITGGLQMSKVVVEKLFGFQSVPEPAFTSFVAQLGRAGGSLFGKV